MTLSKVSLSPKVQQVRHIAGCQDLLVLHRLNPSRYPFLLESVARSEISAVYLKDEETANSRYDILFAFPKTGTLIQEGQLLNNNNFLAQLDHCWQLALGPSFTDVSLPFQGGWFI